MTCKCGLGHRGWEENLCRIELFKRQESAKTVVTTALPAKIKTILERPDKPKKPVTVTKQAKASVTVTPKPVTVTNRMATLRKRKAAQGLIESHGIWTHPDDMAAIKKYAKELADKRC